MSSPLTEPPSSPSHDVQPIKRHKRAHPIQTLKCRLSANRYLIVPTSKWGEGHLVAFNVGLSADRRKPLVQSVPPRIKARIESTAGGISQTMKALDKALPNLKSQCDSDIRTICDDTGYGVYASLLATLAEILCHSGLELSRDISSPSEVQQSHGRTRGCGDRLGCLLTTMIVTPIPLMDRIIPMAAIYPILITNRWTRDTIQKTSRRIIPMAADYSKTFNRQPRR